MINIIYNLSNFKRKVYKCPSGLREVVININEEGCFYVKILGDNVSFLKTSPSDATVFAEYSREYELPESIKFYDQSNDTFYCFENVRQVYEEAARDPIRDYEEGNDETEEDDD